MAYGLNDIIGGDSNANVVDSAEASVGVWEANDSVFESFMNQHGQILGRSEWKRTAVVETYFLITISQRCAYEAGGLASSSQSTARVSYISNDVETNTENTVPCRFTSCHVAGVFRVRVDPRW